MRKCIHCNKEDFKSHQSFGAHISNCKMNPNYITKINKIKKKRKLKNPIKEYIFNCTKCTKEYRLNLSLIQFNNKEFKVHCSRKCANTHTISNETKQKISNSLTGKKYPNRLIHPQEKYNKLCNCGNKISINNKSGYCQLCLRTTTEGKFYMSSILKGKTGGYRTKGGLRFKGQYYKNIWMQSSWEVLMAKKLDELNINWNRNSEIIIPWIDDNNESHKYYPDFYLDEYDMYIEIKGYWTDKSRIKMIKVLEQNKINLLILESIEDINKFAIIV